MKFQMDSSAVLTFVGAAGVIGTSVVTAKCHEKMLKNYPLDPNEKWSDRIKHTWKFYIPAAATGAVSMGCVLLGHHISGKKLAAMTAACTYAVKNREKLEEKIVEVVGKEKYNEIKGKIESYFSEKPHKGQTIEDTGNGKVRFFESYSGRMFFSSKEAVDRAIAFLNERFAEGEYLSLNDFYELLGIEKTYFGEQFGWAANPEYYDSPIDVEVTYDYDEDGTEFGLIEICTYPMECYMEV